MNWIFLKVPLFYKLLTLLKKVRYVKNIYKALINVMLFNAQGIGAIL